MTQKQPLSQLLTQAVEQIAKANIGTAVLKKGAKVPELWVKEGPKKID